MSKSDVSVEISQWSPSHTPFSKSNVSNKRIQMKAVMFTARKHQLLTERAAAAAAAITKELNDAADGAELGGWSATRWPCWRYRNLTDARVARGGTWRCTRTAWCYRNHRKRACMLMASFTHLVSLDAWLWPRFLNWNGRAKTLHVASTSDNRTCYNIHLAKVQNCYYKLSKQNTKIYIQNTQSNITI